MIFTHPWGLLALLSLPLIAGLHFFRSRRQPRRIGGLHLWALARTRLPVGRRFERLIRNLPLLFQLLAALFLSLLIAGVDLPRPSETRHYTILLDDSVSMQAHAQTGAARSSADLARDALRAWARPADRFTLIAAGVRPRVLAGPFAPHAELMTALDTYLPEEPACDLDAALNLAAKFAAGTQRILFVTDDAQTAKGREDTLEVAAFGQAADNCAIDFADRVRQGAGGEAAPSDRIVAVVQAYASIARTTTLRATAAGQTLFEKPISLEPGQPVTLQFDTPTVGETVELMLDDDALAADNHVALAPVPPKVVTAAVSGLGDVEDSVRKAVEAVPFARMGGDTADADLVFTTVASFAPTPRTARVCLLPALSDFGATTGSAAMGRDIVVADPDHPVVDSLPLEGVLWPYDPRAADPAAHTLLAHGATPLLDFAERPDAGFYRLNLRWDRTNLFRSTAWPVLVMGFVEDCRDAMPGLARTNLRVGEQVALRLRPVEGAPKEFVLERDGHELRRYDSLPQTEPSLPAGRYTLSQGGADQVLARFCVNLFTPAESDLRALSAHQPDFTRIEPDSVHETETNRAVYFAALILVIAMAALAWIYFDTSR